MARTNTHVDATLVGERIRALRAKQGLSQRDLEQPGISYAYISRVENGQRTPSLSALVRLAERLQTTALYLLTGAKSGRCPVCQRGQQKPHAER